MLNLNLKGYLQGLPVFLAVEASGSLTRAARVLGVSKAAVSQSLSTLEETLGARLFQRNTRGLSLTEAGRLLAEEARGPVLALKEAAHRIHANAAGVTGELRITASPVAFEPLLLPAIKRLLASHSELRVTVDLNDHFVDIVRSGFDAGIRLGESVEKDMIGRRLRESSPCAVVASPEYLSKRGMPKSPEDVLSHDCIGFRFKDSIVPWEFGQEPNVRTLSITPKLALNSLIACVTALTRRARFGLCAASVNRGEGSRIRGIGGGVERSAHGATHNPTLLFEPETSVAEDQSVVRGAAAKCVEKRAFRGWTQNVAER